MQMPWTFSTFLSFILNIPLKVIVIALLSFSYAPSGALKCGASQLVALISGIILLAAFHRDLMAMEYDVPMLLLLLAVES